MNKLIPVVIVALCFAAIGCTGTEKGAVIGGTSGAVIGGVVGNQLGSTPAGIAVGAVGGALLGGLIGHESEKGSTSSSAQRTIVTCPNGHQVDVTGFPPGSDVRCPVCNTVFKI